MGFFTRFILKHGPGSPGHTARTLCRHVGKYRTISYISHWPEVMLALSKDRRDAYLSNPLGYDENRTWFLAISPQRWKELIEQTKGSLSAFIFVLMYFEATAFRNATGEGNNLTTEQQKQNRKLILEIIYGEVNKTPYNNSLSFNETMKIIEEIGGVYYFHISSSLSKTG